MMSTYATVSLPLFENALGYSRLDYAIDLRADIIAGMMLGLLSATAYWAGKHSTGTSALIMGTD